MFRKIIRVGLLIKWNGFMQLCRLAKIYFIAPWTAQITPFYARIQWKVQIQKQKIFLESELNRLRSCREEILEQGSKGYHVFLSEIEISKECKIELFKNAENENELVIGQIDQDGFLCSHFGPVDYIPVISKENFLPRKRFQLDLVSVKGVLAIRKNYRGQKIHFINEILTLHKLGKAGCNVPAIVDIDFDNLTLYLSYIQGSVLREELAKAGAKLLDRDVDTDVEFVKQHPQQRYLKRIEEGKKLLPKIIDTEFTEKLFHHVRLAHMAGVTQLDIKYGNIIIEKRTGNPFLIDFDSAAHFHDQRKSCFRFYLDQDIKKFNLHFGTKKIYRDEIKRRITEGDIPAVQELYAPVYFQEELHIGRIWDVNSGFGRWHYLLKKHFPPMNNRRVLDLGANNAFNSLQILRSGAREVVAIEMNQKFIMQGWFLKDAFEWVDNRDLNLKYCQGNMRDLQKMDLGTFDFAIALCCIYYLSEPEIANTIQHVSRLTGTFILQCNLASSIGRADTETYRRATVEYAIEALTNNGFPNIKVIAPKGYPRPLVFGKK